MEFTRFHTQETVYGVQGANTCNEQSDKCYHGKYGDYDSGFGQHNKPGLIFEANLETVPDDDACKYGRCKSYPQITADERFANERPLGSHQFHGVKHKTLGVDGEFDGVVYQCERYQREYHGQDQQQSGNLADIAVDDIQQVFLPCHLTHSLIRGDLLFYHLKAVVAGIIGLQTDVE